MLKNLGTLDIKYQIEEKVIKVFSPFHIFFY